MSYLAVSESLELSKCRCRLELSRKEAELARMRAKQEAGEAVIASMTAHREMERASMQRSLELRVQVCPSLSAFARTFKHVNICHV